MRKKEVYFVRKKYSLSAILFPFQLVGVTSFFDGEFAQSDEIDQEAYEQVLNVIMENPSEYTRNYEIRKNVEQWMKNCVEKAKEGIESSEEYVGGSQIDILSAQILPGYVKRLQATAKALDAQSIAADVYEMCDQLRQRANMMRTKL